MSRLMNDPEVMFSMAVLAAVALVWHDSNGSRGAAETLHRACELFNDIVKKAAAREREEEL